MMDTRAHLEQLESSLNHESAPSLIWFHDGGGTVFQYYMLGSLSRQVYAIANPYFTNGSRPEGGFSQLAIEYTQAIRSELGPGDVLLGGWSFGGLLSIEVARLLVDDSQIRVIGLLIIDSVCPWSDSFKLRGRIRPNYRESTSDAMREKVNKSFDNARDMIRGWERPPEFNAPPAIVIRAQDAIGIKNAPDGIEQTSDQDGIMGWSRYPCIRVQSVVTVPGDHFTMFADDQLDDMTEHIRKACATLTEISAS